MTAEVQPVEIILLNARQVAQLLNISERSVANLRYRGQLQSRKIGANRRYFLDDVRKLAATGAGSGEVAAAR